MSRNLVCFALLAGCLFKPNRVDPNGGDGGGSSFEDAPVKLDTGTTPDFTARLAARAYWNLEAGTGTPMMDHETFALPSTNVVAGELVLLIGSVDNQPVITAPPGFTLLTKTPYGDGETQTYVAYWKIATTNEPAYYIGKYPNNNTTGASSAAGAYVLLTIGMARDSPSIVTQNEICAPNCTYSLMMPTPSQGVGTTVDNSIVIYAAGGNWLSTDGLDVYDLPAGFTLLTAFGDYGTNRFNWTDIMVGWQLVPTARPAVAVSGMITADQPNHMSMGSPWTVEIAVAPQ
ncbi:MAG TPA: hypothetical protein VFQ65_06700 [Kofleriaceae bacterium]|nr:hypothetical protein [Kofleriaceae bacterium]